MPTLSTSTGPDGLDVDLLSFSSVASLWLRGGLSVYSEVFTPAVGDSSSFAHIGMTFDPVFVLSPVEHAGGPGGRPGPCGDVEQ